MSDTPHLSDRLAVLAQRHACPDLARVALDVGRLELQHTRACRMLDEIVADAMQDAPPPVKAWPVLRVVR